MTTKKFFEAKEPNVEVLKNGRYAYKVMCPWKGKNGKDLYAFKWCGTADYEYYQKQQEGAKKTEEKGEESEEEEMEIP